MLGLLGTWWVWGAAALVLGILEVAIPGFVFLGVAAGAALISLALAAGLSTSLPVLVFLFALASLAIVLILRRLFALPSGQVKRFHDDIND